MAVNPPWPADKPMTAMGTATDDDAAMGSAVRADMEADMGTDVEANMGATMKGKMRSTVRSSVWATMRSAVPAMRSCLGRRVDHGDCQSCYRDSRKRIRNRKCGC
jgi:hypothetical protein